MAAPEPGIRAFAVNVAAGGVAPEGILVLGAIGTNGTGTADTITRFLDEGTARAFFGDSEASEAISHIFRRTVLRQRLAVWGLGFDAAAWTVSTRTATWTGTTTASGSRLLRLGPDIVVVPLAKGADATAQAAAANDAVNNAGIPWTSSVLAGVQTITSKHKGAAVNRVPVTIDLYANETGVPGSSVAIVNNDDATGEPAALSSTQIDEIKKVSGLVYWVGNNALAAHLDSINDVIEDGWLFRNAYANYFAGYATTTEAEFRTLLAPGSVPRNQLHESLFQQLQSPNYETIVGVAAVEAILIAREANEVENPGLIDETLPAVSPPVIIPDVVACHSVGGNCITRTPDGGARVESMITSRLKNNQDQPDLSETYVGPKLARRASLEDMIRTFTPLIGKNTVDDSVDPGAGWTNVAEVREKAGLALNGQIDRKLVRAPVGTGPDLVVDVQEATTVNIKAGFLLTYLLPVPQPATTFTVKALTS